MQHPSILYCRIASLHSIMTGSPNLAQTRTARDRNGIYVMVLEKCLSSILWGCTCDINKIYIGILAWNISNHSRSWVFSGMSTLYVKINKYSSMVFRIESYIFHWIWSLWQKYWLNFIVQFTFIIKPIFTWYHCRFWIVHVYKYIDQRVPLSFGFSALFWTIDNKEN